jgi:putative AbiEi antitoxin of type IV toxin-antitoxin system
VAEKLDELRLDPRLADVAARQHAVITRSQLVALGSRDDAIASRVRAGWLVRVHRGVLAVGRQPLTLHRRFLAAVFSAGELERAIDEAAYLRLDVRGLRPPAGSRRRREGHTVDFA